MRILTIILLILGAAAAVPAASDAFHRAADPRAVLRQVEQAQTEYRTRHGRYTASLRALGIDQSADVDVRIIAEGSAGYSVVVSADAEECAVYHGSARPPRNWVRTPGRIVCRSS